MRVHQGTARKHGDCNFCFSTYDNLSTGQIRDRRVWVMRGEGDHVTLQARMCDECFDQMLAVRAGGPSPRSIADPELVVFVKPGVRVAVRERASR